MPKQSKFIQYLFYPVIILGGLLGAWYLTLEFRTDYFVYIPLIMIFFMLIVVFILEKFRPFRKEWTKPKGDSFNDALQTFFVLPVSSKLTEIALVFLLLAPSIHLNNALGYSGFMNELPVLVQFIAVLFIAEFFFYWYHRFMHTNSRLWQLHAVHHAAERLYSVNSGRFHLIENVIGSACYYFVLMLLQVPDQVVVLFFTVTLMSGFLEHVNIDYRLGPFNYILNSAQLHRWHHSKDIKQSNSNYGKVLIVWDIVFGTFYLPKDKEVGVLGINEPEKMPNTFLGQLKYPFRK